MKKILLFCLGMLIIIVSSASAQAEQRGWLGERNFSLKAGYVSFTDSVVEDSGADSGFYGAIEGYVEAYQNLYIGAEIGYAQPTGTTTITVSGTNAAVDTEVIFVPVELNLKYALKPAAQLVVDFGVGFAGIYVKEELSTNNQTIATIDHWLPAGQIFTDINWRSAQFFFGINAKYQFTGDFEDHSYTNWRVGGQLGVIF